MSRGGTSMGVNSRIQESGARIESPQNWWMKRTSPSHMFLTWSTP